MIIVTGGSRGIGAETAVRLAAAGEVVAVGYRSNGDEAASVVERCREAGGSAAAFRADVAVEADVERLFVRAEATLALANGLFIAFLLLGGIVLPVSHLPGPLAALAGIMPAAALADAFRVGLGAGGDALEPLLVVAAWGIAAIALAVRTFRWE